MHADDIADYLLCLNLKTVWVDNFKALSVIRLNDGVEVCTLPLTPTTSITHRQLMELVPDTLDSYTEAQLLRIGGFADFAMWNLGTFLYKLDGYKQEVAFYVNTNGRHVLLKSMSIESLLDGEEVRVSIMGKTVYKKLPIELALRKF